MNLELQLLIRDFSNWEAICGAPLQTLVPVSLGFLTYSIDATGGSTTVEAIRVVPACSDGLLNW